MAISAVYANFAPEIAECLEEAFERAGIAPIAIGAEHIQSALRSVKFMLGSEWQTLGIRQWMIVRASQALTVGLVSFDLPAGAIDVMDMVLRRSNNDTPMHRMSRIDWLQTVDKTTQGRPDRYVVYRLYDRCTVYLWRLPENATDTLVIDYVRSISNPGAIGNTLQLPPYTLEAFVSGLAARLAMKFKPEKYQLLQIAYRGPDQSKIGGALKAALDEGRERVDLQINFAPSRYYGR